MVEGRGGAGRSARRVLAGVLGFIGAIWFGQGIGLIGGSFMTGDNTWTSIGAGTVIVAVLIARPWRRD